MKNEKEYKDRLTITLSPSILKKVDSMVDGKSVRNRSHAIETILSQHILSRVTKVIILAGGKGANMRPLTYEIPKAMLPVHDRPLVEYSITSLVAAGLRDITIVVGHLGNKVEQAFGDGSRFGARITYVQDLEESGTAQALAAARNVVGDNPFLLLYGDVLASVDWLSLIDFHDQQQSLLTMAVTTVTDTTPWGVVKMQGAHITDLEQHHGAGTGNSHLINSGVYVVDPSVLSRITPTTKSFEDEIVAPMTNRQEVAGYHFSGQWFDVGSSTEYARALKEWSIR